MFIKIFLMPLLLNQLHAL